MNKTQTRKLRKALAEQGTGDTTLYIGKSSIGLWYIGDENIAVVIGFDNNYKSADEAIQACLDGKRPEEAKRVV